MHSGGPDISSGFGPAPGVLATKLTRGDPLVIKGVSYTFEREISKSTGEAEIYLLLQNGQACVFKLYYPNFKPKEAILAPLKQLRHEDIINVIDYGYHHDRFFEIMEYAEGGTLEQYLPIRALQRLRKIVSETVNAFKFCHDRGIVHRDIKPENIYCRSADGTDFVIGDFGISSALDAGISRHLTSQNLTAGYAAPEMYGYGGKVIVGREVDYYALGITLIHLWQGKSPFDGLTIHYIANLTNTGAINVPNDLPDALQTLIRGLITIDFAKRWGYDEVQRWLKGENVPVHFHVKEITYPQFQFDSSQKASSPVALARLLKASPDRGKKLLYSGKISAWVNVFDPALAAELDRIVEDEYPKSQDAGLQKTIYVLDPDEPFTQVNRECRTAKELATELDDQFDFYSSQLTNPNYSIYLYLEAHEEKKEADAFRAYFRTFSAKKALNTVILELAGRESVAILGAVFTNPEAVLQARNRPDVVNMLKDRESKLSLWMEGAASKSVNAQLDAWRALKICDATTLAYVSDKGDGVPQLGLSKNAFSFTDLKCRGVTSDSFDIRNTGGGALTGSITSDKNWLRLAQTQIDANRKSQTISFSIDTAGLPFGATDTAAIAVQSNVGTETVSVAIAIEQGAQAAGRFRKLMTVGAAVAGALLGLVIHKLSGLAGVADPSGLVGLVAPVGMAALAATTAKKNGKEPLLPSIATLALGALALGYLSASFPFAFSALSWALLFMAIAYAIAPSTLKLTQVATSRVSVPIGILAGTTALSSLMVIGDRQLGGVQDRLQIALRGDSQPTPTKPSTVVNGARLSIFGLGPIRIGMSMAEVERASGLTFRGAAEQSGQSCYYVDYQSQTGRISLLLKNGRVAVVSAYGPEYATLSGVQTGDSESKVRAAYRTGLSEFRSTDNDGSDALIFVPKDPSESQYRIVFSLIGGPTAGAPPVVGSIEAAKLPDGQYLLTGSAIDGCLDHIGAARQLTRTKSIQLLDASMPGDLFVLGTNLKYGASTIYDPSKPNDPSVRGTIRAWDAASGMRTAEWPAHSATIQSLAISPRGDLLASSGSDRSVAVWRLPEGNQVAKWMDSTDSIQSLSFDSTGSTLVGSGAKVVRIWSATTGSLRSSITKGDGPTAVSPDGGLIASPSAVFEARSGRVVRAIEVEGASMCMAFSPDGRYLALCQWDRIELWDVSSWRVVWKFHRTSRHVPFNALAFHPNGQHLAATLGDSIWLLDLRTGEPISVVPGSQKATTFTALGFDPSDNALVAVRGSELNRWATANK